MDEIISWTEYQDVAVHALLDLVESEGDKGSDGDRATISMGINGLSSLLKHNAFTSEPGSLTTEMEVRLVKLALEYMQAPDADIRSMVVPYVLEVHDQMDSESKFWEMMSSAPVESKNLMSYYLEKRAH